MRENSESSVACHHRVGFLGLLVTLGIDEPKALGLDTSMVVVERVPLIISQHNRSIRRIEQMEEEK